MGPLPDKHCARIYLKRETGTYTCQVCSVRGFGAQCWHCGTREITFDFSYDVKNLPSYVPPPPSENAHPPMTWAEAFARAAAAGAGVAV